MNTINLISDYLGGASQHNLWKKYKINFKKIREILKNNNIKIRQRKKYIFDENYFKEIDSFYKAYFLGLIEADGCVFKCRPTDKLVGKFTLSLQERDGYLVDKLVQEIKIQKKPIIVSRKYPRQNQKKISFANKIFTKNLNNLGCGERKSFVLEFPIKIPDNLIEAFLLGYFDGDGSIVVHKNLKKAVLRITSSVPFCEKVLEILNNKYDLGGCLLTKKCQGGIIGDASYCGNLQILQIFHILYRNSPFFLKRKYDKFIELIKINPNKYIQYLSTIDNYWQKLWKEI
jgi:hypothetical protein